MTLITESHAIIEALNESTFDEKLAFMLHHNADYSVDDTKNAKNKQKVFHY